MANPERIEMSRKDIDRLLEDAEGKLLPEHYENLEKLITAYETLTGLVEDKSMTIRKLRKLLFGHSTEKTSTVVPDSKGDGEGTGESDNKGGVDARAGTAEDGSGEDAEADEDAETKKDSKPPPKGHGRNGADAYPGAKRVPVPHPSLKHGNLCPSCPNGIVYRQKKPGLVVRITGQAPLGATVYERERLRCNLCEEVFTAELPEEAGDQKYDATATSMIALLNYGSGLPFNRLAGLQGALGIPLSASTQWDIVHRGAKVLDPVYEELVSQAGQGDLVHNDDTGIKILELRKESPEEAAEKDGLPAGRTGVSTTGVVSYVEDHRIALFFTGRKHAGEVLSDVLSRRAEELSAPIQMCDGLLSNVPSEFAVILSNCIPHGRRKFVELAETFPEECRFVLETFKDVYKNEADTVDQELSDEKRLEYHQEHSKPLMDELEEWFARQFAEKLVEPNSSLGRAITYMTKRWEGMTLFLRVPGAPLDNNICERALKKVVLRRKNSLFFKTRTGARVGDVYLSLIHSAELEGANPLDYLTELLRHPDEIATEPEKWLPWNYREHLELTQSA